MKWRCEHCGKPHERNDPPCDNCGHSEFEKAVVPMAPEAEDEEATKTYAWICTECGNDHPKHTPPCDRCGNATLERRELSYDEDEIVDEMLEDSSGRASTADVSYLDVLDAKLVLLFLGVAALVAYLALGFLGVVQIPGISPTPPVPGNATTADGLVFADVESAYVDELNARRSAEGFANLTADENLASAATYLNQQVVRAEYGDSDSPSVDRSEIDSRLGDDCADGYAPATYSYDLDQASDTPTERELARRLAESYERTSSFEDTADELIGVDLHAGPDGVLYVTRIVC
ncbi:hypothetical protein [Halorientalis pallida]|uniref:Uncharacterized protein n=1 Tax=Halorientalis pallida TaxID=2479928 RepID=A0A498KWB8_9EURY|nr:hypothetical protein [Halorientalis pallida]RXK49517.1 hypothetical protein EAF64_11470 [Halorientalis pallida]